MSTSRIAHLSLRFCEISDTGAESLALALGNLRKQNWKLLNLILTGNQIGDRGAKALATVTIESTSFPLNQLLARRCVTIER